MGAGAWIAIALLGTSGFASADLQSEQEAALEGLNAQRQQIGLPPLVGNPAQDVPTLANECQAGVVGSCRLAINLQRGASGLPPLAFANPAHDEPLLTAECQAGVGSSCGLLQMEQQQTQPAAQAPAPTPTPAQPGMPAPGGHAPQSVTGIPDWLTQQQDQLMRQIAADAEKERREAPIRRQRLAERTRKLTEGCNGGDQEKCDELRELEKEQQRAKMRAMDAQIRALDFQQHVSESNAATEERVELHESEAHARHNADEYKSESEYWAEHGDVERAKEADENRKEELRRADEYKEQEKQK